MQGICENIIEYKYLGEMLGIAATLIVQSGVKDFSKNVCDIFHDDHP